MPPCASIIACLDKAEIEVLAHPAKNAALAFHDIVFFLSAPWLLKAVSNTNTNDPALIILAASEIAEKFDNKHENDNEMSQAPRTSSKNLSNGHGESKPEKFLG
jgi:hypothetical protein